MDDPNITMEEYIRLEEEKAQKHGKVFNWETAKYGRILHDEDVHDLRSVENKFPAIAFNDSLKSGETLSCEPTKITRYQYDISWGMDTTYQLLDLVKEISTNIGGEFTNLEILKKSSSPSPPNTPSKTPSTKETSSTFETTSSSFESKPHSLPLSSRNTPSHQPTNHFLDDPLDAFPRPSNPLPFQSHPSLDITLSLSPITPLDHMFETPSRPPPPPPQPPLMGHPIYFNVFDYHGAHCLCCFHNQNLILSLRDEMHFMFSHLEYLLTSAIASPSPPHH
ncbi:hypothetical protein Tco_0606330 [Tanacetum coccineum]